MPSSSKKQHNFMAAVAKNPDFAKKAGVPSSVGSDFIKADKGRTFGKGGKIMAKPMPMFGGKESYAEEMKEAKAIKSGKITPQQYAKAEGKEKTKPKQTSFAIGGAIPSAGRFGSAGRYSPPPPAAGRFDAAGKYSPPTPAAGRFSSPPPAAAQGMRAPLAASQMSSGGNPNMQAQFAAAQQASLNDAKSAYGAQAANQSAQMNRPMPAGGSGYRADELAAARAAQMRDAEASPPPQPIPLSPMQGAPAFKKGGFIKSADGIASKGKTKAQQFSSGGRVSSRADGIATKGKTRGKMC